MGQRFTKIRGANIVLNQCRFLFSLDKRGNVDVRLEITKMTWMSGDGNGLFERPGWLGTETAVASRLGEVAGELKRARWVDLEEDGVETRCFLTLVICACPQRHGPMAILRWPGTTAKANPNNLDPPPKPTPNITPPPHPLPTPTDHITHITNPLHPLP
jgi:hypothetical protein